MRVSSLSDPAVIDLIAKYFVPVWVSRDHYQQAAPSEAEKAELLRIDRDQTKRGLEGGAVCVFILAPDGAVSATMPVQKASKPANLTPFLQKIVDDQKLTPRAEEAIKATAAPPRPAAKAATEGGMMLSVWTRYENLKENRGVAQDAVEWKADEWAAFAPAADAKLGDVLPVPQETANKLFRLFYPPTPRWDAREVEVTGGKLTATVVAVEHGEVRLRLDGDVELKFPVKVQPVGKVTATLVGAAHYDPAKKTFTSFALTSETGEHSFTWDGKPEHRNIMTGVEMQP
jgi:hypothetical protein